MDYQIQGAESEEDLRQILTLQDANLRANLDAEARRAHGFVTLRHDLALLREMSGPWRHAIAVSEGAVVAYALVMLEQFRHRLPELEAMFKRLERLSFGGRPIPQLRFYIMGQICVVREHRGRGLVERLYAEHRRRMSPHFDLMITDIDRENPRSLRAHERAGFEVIDEYRGDDGQQWLIVVMDLRRPTAD
jgi:hypothetical protein